MPWCSVQHLEARRAKEWSHANVRTRIAVHQRTHAYKEYRYADSSDHCKPEQGEERFEGGVASANKTGDYISNVANRGSDWERLRSRAKRMNSTYR